MSGARDLVRWVRLWGSLPEEERRARAGRVADRLLRRSSIIRSLGLAPSTPSWRSFEQALDVPLDAVVGRLARVSPEWIPTPTNVTPEAPRPFDFDWHADRKSGVRWDPAAYFTDIVTVRLDGSDVKVPWELSRLQHLIPMGGGRSTEASAIALSWIADNPPGFGVNWASPMEVALRAVSLSAALGFFRGLPGWEPPVLREIARALWVHGLHVRRNLEIPETDPATNHYLADLVGLLAVARALPELREAAAWGELARSGLIDEIERQVGADGVSFERSIPYHGFVTELFAHAARLEAATKRAMPERFLARLASMLEALAWSLRPDGTIPAVGDNDGGFVLKFSPSTMATEADRRFILELSGPLVGRPDLAAVTPYAPWSGTCGRRFESSGWHVMRGRDVHVGVAAGTVGTRGLGNHTHNDLFAPTYWWAGRDWIVDPGTGSYARDPALRNRLRGVAAHAALQLGTREPNELPPGRDGLFRVIEGSHPEVLAWEATRDRAVLTARHTGYSGPEGGWTWQRRLTFDATTEILTGEDRLEASQATNVAAAPQDVWLRFPLGLGVAATIETESGPRISVRLRDPAIGSLELELTVPAGSLARIEPCEVSPSYDVVRESSAVVVRMPAARVLEARFSLHGGRKLVDEIPAR